MDIVILLIGILTLTSLGYVIYKFNSKDTDVDDPQKRQDDINQMKEILTLQFKNLANEIIDEKTKKINAIKLDIKWSDLGSWKEILLMFKRNKKKYFKKKNIFYRPWGSYTNLYYGNNFLIKELNVKSKGVLSLQKHFHRSEHWLITQGVPKITLNKKSFSKKLNETIFIPKGAIHRVQNPYKKTVKIMEAQLGSILKETDIVRYEDIYGRVN